MLKTILALAVLLPVQSYAMCVSRSYKPIAWNENGRAVVVEETARGPEGGGSLSFLIVDFATDQTERFTVSSDYSHGGSEHPQAISLIECDATVKKANAALKSFNFKSRLRVCANRHHLFDSQDTAGVKLPPEATKALLKKFDLVAANESSAFTTKNGKDLLFSEASFCQFKCFLASNDTPTSPAKKLRDCTK